MTGSRFYVQKTKAYFTAYYKNQLIAQWRLATDYELEVLKSAKTVKRNNVENKISALNSLFNTIGLIDDKIGELTGFIFSGIETLIAKVFKKGEDKDGKK